MIINMVKTLTRKLEWFKIDWKEVFMAAKKFENLWAYSKVKERRGLRDAWTESASPENSEEIISQTKTKMLKLIHRFKAYCHSNKGYKPNCQIKTNAITAAQSYKRGALIEQLNELKRTCYLKTGRLIDVKDLIQELTTKDR